MSVIVVNHSTQGEKSSSAEGNTSTAAGKGSGDNRNNIKEVAQKVERVSTMNNLKNRNGLTEVANVERAGVSKGSNFIVKEQTSKEGGVSASLKSGGNNTKQKTVEEKGKEMKEKTTGENAERLRNGLQRQKFQGMSCLTSRKENRPWSLTFTTVVLQEEQCNRLAISSLSSI